MLRFDYTHLSTDRVGSTHGLPLERIFAEYGARMETLVRELYASKDDVGGWKKWLNLGYDRALAESIQQYADRVRGQFTDLVVLGIGGSSLGGYALLKALLHPYWNNLPEARRQGLPRFHFVENVDGDQIHGLLDVLNLKTTLVNVISKSGTTAETMSAFMLLQARLIETFGSPEAARDHVVLTTDASSGILRQLANQHGYTAFEVPDDVGGRFSVFSAVGLLPAALCGVNIEEIQQGIRDLDAVLQNTDLRENPAAQNALFQYLFYQQGKPISVIMPYSYRLAAVSDWYVQLWAESLGKKMDRQGRVVHVGPTPVRAVGVTDQHSQVQLFNEGPFDKVFTFIQVETPEHTLTIPDAFPTVPDLAYLGNQSFHQLLNAEFESTRASLTKNMRPNATLTVPCVTPYYFGQLLYFLEVQTALAGALFQIDPFDQPGVELAKKYTYALMGRKGYEHLVEEARGGANIVTSAAV
ncbi:MAG: glucose-6-phosphate isomerase [Candidatus Melainabacteria bacterium]|nr:glucose-6-phosphate isomerase [Candidatus Melainabacteria bacterium]